MGILQYSVYAGRDKSIFIVSPKKIIVQTPTQEFYLSPEEWDCNDKLDMIAYFIQNGTIQDIASLRRRTKGLFYLETTHRRHIVLDSI